MVNKPLIRPYFWGGYVRGGRLTSHDMYELPTRWIDCPTSRFFHDSFLQDGLYVRSGLNSHYFHIIGDKLINPNSRGLYTHYKDSLLKVGWPSPIQGV